MTDERALLAGCKAHFTEPPRQQPATSITGSFINLLNLVPCRSHPRQGEMGNRASTEDASMNFSRLAGEVHGGQPSSRARAASVPQPADKSRNAGKKALVDGPRPALLNVKSTASVFPPQRPLMLSQAHFMLGMPPPQSNSLPLFTFPSSYFLITRLFTNYLFSCSEQETRQRCRAIPTPFSSSEPEAKEAPLPLSLQMAR